MKKKVEELKVIKDIYEGNISFDDKCFVNKMCDTLWQEIDDIKEGKIKVSNMEICKKYEELIRLVEIERFAQGAKFMYELIDEINSVSEYGVGEGMVLKN